MSINKNEKKKELFYFAGNYCSILNEKTLEMSKCLLTSEQPKKNQQKRNIKYLYVIWVETTDCRCVQMIIGITISQHSPHAGIQCSIQFWQRKWEGIQLFYQNILNSETFDHKFIHIFLKSISISEILFVFSLNIFFFNFGCIFQFVAFGRFHTWLAMCCI